MCIRPGYTGHLQEPHCKPRRLPREHLGQPWHVWARISELLIIYLITDTTPGDEMNFVVNHMTHRTESFFWIGYGTSVAPSLDFYVVWTGLQLCDSNAVFWIRYGVQVRFCYMVRFVQGICFQNRTSVAAYFGVPLINELLLNYIWKKWFKVVRSYMDRFIYIYMITSGQLADPCGPCLEALFT